MDYQWETWVSEIADFATFRGAFGYRPETVQFTVDRFAEACRSANIPLVYQSHRRYYTRQDRVDFHPDRIDCLRQEVQLHACSVVQGELMKQCPECSRYYQYYMSACKCGYVFTAPQDTKSDADTPEGSLILFFCTLFSAVGILVAIGYGLYLITQHRPVIGIVTGAIGAVYHAGLMIVFQEANRIIGIRKAAQPSP